MVECHVTLTPEGDRYYQPQSIEEGDVSVDGVSSEDENGALLVEEDCSSNSEDEQMEEEPVLQNEDPKPCSFDATSASTVPKGDSIVSVASKDIVAQTFLERDADCSINHFANVDNVVKKKEFSDSEIDNALRIDSGFVQKTPVVSEINLQEDNRTDFVVGENQLVAVFGNLRPTGKDDNLSSSIDNITALGVGLVPGLQDERIVERPASGSRNRQDMAIGCLQGPKIDSNVAGHCDCVADLGGDKQSVIISQTEGCGATAGGSTAGGSQQVDKVEFVGKSGLVCVQEPRTWANVVRGRENDTLIPTGHSGMLESKRPPKMMKLSFKKPIVKEDGSITTKISKEVADKGIEIWKHTLVGYFYDKTSHNRVKGVVLAVF